MRHNPDELAAAFKAFERPAASQHPFEVIQIMVDKSRASVERHVRAFMGAGIVPASALPADAEGLASFVYHQVLGPVVDAMEAEEQARVWVAPRGNPGSPALEAAFDAFERAVASRHPYEIIQIMVGKNREAVVQHVRALMEAGIVPASILPDYDDGFVDFIYHQVLGPVGDAMEAAEQARTRSNPEQPARRQRWYFTWADDGDTSYEDAYSREDAIAQARTRGPAGQFYKGIPMRVLVPVPETFTAVPLDGSYEDEKTAMKQAMEKHRQRFPRSNPAASQPTMKCRAIRIPAHAPHTHCAHCNKALPAGSRAYGVTPDPAHLPAGVNPAEQPVYPVCSLGCAAALVGAAS